MTRAELVRVVDIVTAAWNTHADDHNRTVRVWWRYLQDLEYGDVLNVVDRLVVTSNWAPKVGEVRRRVLDGTEPSDAPTVTQAWAQAADRMRAVEQGTEWPPVHELVTAALRETGAGPGRLDERSFRQTYERLLADHDESRLLPPLPEPFGDVK